MIYKNVQSPDIKGTHMTTYFDGITIVYFNIVWLIVGFDGETWIIIVKKCYFDGILKP